MEEIVKLMRLFELAPVNRVVLDSARLSGFKDFEAWEMARRVRRKYRGGRG